MSQDLPTGFGNKHAMDRAREELLADATALPKDKLVHLAVDVGQASMLVNQVVIKGEDLMDDLTRAGFTKANLDYLLKVSLGTWQSEANYLVTREPSQNVEPIYIELLEARDDMGVVVNGLIRFDVLDPKVLERLNGLVGHFNVAQDVTAQVSIFTNNWATVKSKVPVTEPYLERVKDLAATLAQAAAKKELSPAEQEKAALERHQFFSLMFHWYDRFQKAMSHIRWDHKDVESWAPSIYSGNGAGRPKKAAAKQASPAPAPAAPAAPADPPKPAVGAGFADEDPLEKKP